MAKNIYVHGLVNKQAKNIELRTCKRKMSSLARTPTIVTESGFNYVELRD